MTAIPRIGRTLPDQGKFQTESAAFDLHFSRRIALAGRQHAQFAYAVAIPARNEEDRIVGCLDACWKSMTGCALPGLIVLLVNNSRDRTASRAAQWSRLRATPVEIICAEIPPAYAHAGGARRAALDSARRHVRADGALLTTDADSRPDCAWVGANLAALDCGAALVCGKVELDPMEFARLPSTVVEMGEIEDIYRRATLELISLLDPDPANPWPHHGQASGASLAISVGAYERIGGAPMIAVGEDRALARRVLEHDLAVVHSDRARVVTSCRLDGRARGGMAETIASRLCATDYLCDEFLEPPDQTIRRTSLRATLRRLSHRRHSTRELLRRAGLSTEQQDDALALDSFGAFWGTVERSSPILARRPFFWSAMRAELPRLLALLANARMRLHFDSGTTADQVVALRSSGQGVSP